MITSLLSTLSAVAVGLMSGLYWAFTVVVMPSLRANDDRSFIAFMQTTNQVTISIWFLPVFVGSLLLPIAAAVALLAGGNDGAKRWGIVGAILAAISVAITVGGNAPLNLALDRAGDVASIGDPASVRRAFEGTWTRLNLWRTITSTVALFALIRAAMQLR